MNLKGTVRKKFRYFSRILNKKYKTQNFSFEENHPEKNIKKYFKTDHISIKVPEKDIKNSTSNFLEIKGIFFLFAKEASSANSLSFTAPITRLKLSIRCELIIFFMESESDWLSKMNVSILAPSMGKLSIAICMP